MFFFISFIFFLNLGQKGLANLDCYQNGFTSQTCQFDNFIIDCSDNSSYIEITSAFYGRLDTTACKDNCDYYKSGECPIQYFMNTNCVSSYAFERFSDLCNNKPICEFVLNDDLMCGDPCLSTYYTYKYALVDYNCNHRENIPEVVVCDYDIVNLKCYGEQVIQVLNATYGRYDSVTCMTSCLNYKSVNECQVSKMTTNCHSDVFSIISGLCDNINECFINSSYLKIMDSCPSVYKYIKITYQCALYNQRNSVTTASSIATTASSTTASTTTTTLYPFILTAKEVSNFITANFTTLTIDNKGITSIDPNAFKNYSSTLKSINLYLNQITSLDNITFKDLPQLTKLYISNNKISVLPIGLFDNLTKFTHCIINSNQLSSLQANTFQYANSIQTLSLATNNLTSIDSSMFNGLNSLKYLYLSANRIQTIASKTFQSLKTLQYLFLHLNYLTYLNNDTFNSELVFLNLSFNRLQTIPVTTFQALTKLTGLHLQSNNLTNLDLGLFLNLTSLIKLDLFQNKISNIVPNLFRSCNSLAYLNMSYNLLTNLNDDMFVGLTNISRMDFSNNKIATIASGTFIDLSTTLTLIYLNNNQLTSSLSPNLFSFSLTVYIANQSFYFENSFFIASTGTNLTIIN